MANIETRSRSDGSLVHYVRWRHEGKRDGERCAEKFEERRGERGGTALQRAERFKIDVDLAGNVWPPLWVPGHGYVTAEEMARLQELAAEADKPRSLMFLNHAGDTIDALSGIESKTRANYHRLVANHMAPYVPFACADMYDLDSLTAQHVSRWVNWLQEGVRSPEDPAVWLRAPLAPKSIANLHGLLHLIMKALTVGERPIRRYNPCIGTELPESDAGVDDEEMVFLTHEEFAILYQAADATVRDVFEAFVATGERFSELTAHQVRDWTAGSVRVSRAWKRQADDTFKLGAPKSKAGRRSIALDADTDALFASRCRNRPRDAYVFTTRTGVPIRHNNFFCRYWQPAVYRAVRCEEHRRVDREEGMLLGGQRVRLTNLKALRQRHLIPCGCPGTLNKVPRIHDLRHTHIAWQIAAGVPLKAIARRVGHESTTTTDKTYGHLLPELDTRQTEAVAVALAGVRRRTGGS